MSLPDGLYIKKQFQSQIIKIPIESTGTTILYKTRYPLYSDELWNEYYNIQIPPDFSNYLDGTISNSGIVQLFRNRILEKETDNIFKLVNNVELLSRIIFNSDYNDNNHSLISILKTIPTLPGYYNPVLTDANNNSYSYNEINWMIDSINKKIQINSDFLKKIKEPITITFARYIGSYGGGLGNTGPTGLGITGTTGPSGFSTNTGATGCITSR